MAQLLLVRHAAAVRPVLGGPNEYERPLTPGGREQARALVDVLVGYAPGQVLASPYARAVATVQPTASRLGLPVLLREDLREWQSGLAPTPDWEPHYRRAWRHPDQALPGGESLDALAERVAAVLRAMAAQGDRYVVLASHGTWITVALRLLGVPVDEELWLRMPSPAVYEVSSTDGTATARGPGLPLR